MYTFVAIFMLCEEFHQEYLTECGHEEVSQILLLET